MDIYNCSRNVFNGLTTAILRCKFETFRMKRIIFFTAPSNPLKFQLVLLTHCCLQTTLINYLVIRLTGVLLLVIKTPICLKLGQTYGNYDNI